jgi:predicted metallopeptidase
VVQRADSGQPLDVSTRSFMESRFGADFGGVRLHTNHLAAESARQLSAHAYTVGSDIFFGHGQYQPTTTPGRRLLAHELVHVLQQASGSPGSAGPISEPGDVGEREAERVARDVLAREASGPVSVPRLAIRRSTASGRAMIQRMSINSCSPAEAKQIVDAVQDAQVGIALAIQAIMTPGSDPAALNRFYRFFGTSAWGSIAQELGKILTGLPNATYECEYPGSLGYSYFCGENIAYVRSALALMGYGEIHLCQPQFSALSAAERVHTIVHEAAHRFVPALGDTYYAANCADTAETIALSDDDRRYNADCYGCFIQMGLPGAPAPPVQVPAPPAGGGP